MYTVMNFRVCNLSLIDVMEILLSRSKQYGNENKTNGQWMKKTILFFLLIFLFIMRVASQSEKSILEVKGCVIDIIEVKYGAAVFSARWEHAEIWNIDTKMYFGERKCIKYYGYGWTVSGA